MADHAQRAEARLYLRWAAQMLNKTERCALEAWLSDRTAADLARELGITSGGVFMARMQALQKMRRRLAMLRIESAEALL